MRYIFDELRPDQPAHLNEGLVMADGCVPIKNGYAPFPSSSPIANGNLGAAPYGAGAYRVGETVYLFVATATEIKRYLTSGYSTVGSGYTNISEFQVRFEPYNTLMLAVNGVDQVQKFDPTGGGFTTLSASAPTARYIAVVRGFVVVGAADEDPLQVAWSDSGDPTTWTPGTGDAGFAIMSSGGDITGIVGGEYGLIFQESRIVRMTATGDDLVWQFDEIASDVGCIAPKSIATYGRITFFLSEKGLMACDGVTVSSVGAEKIDRTLLGMLDRSYFQDMSAAIDPRNSLYIMAIPAARPTNSTLIYNFALERFTTAPITSKLLFSGLAQGVSLEDLDAIYGFLDTMPVSLDSAAFRGGFPLLLTFDGNNTLSSFSGSNVAAMFIDGVKEMAAGQKVRVRMVRPMTDAAAVQIGVTTSNSLAETQTNNPFTMVTTSGVYRTRAVGNYIQTGISIPAGATWRFCQGYDIDAVPAGRA